MLVRTILICLVGLVSSVNAQQFPTPSKEHEIVMRDVGEWEITGKMMMPQGAMEFKGEEKVVPVGKFWTVSHYSSDFFGGLKGSATIGFDPASKKFIGTWVDSFQPAVTKMNGTYDEKTNTMTFETKGMGMDGKPMPGRIVIKYNDENSHTFTMMQKDPTGQSEELVKTMEMTYKRKSAK